MNASNTRPTPHVFDRLIAKAARLLARGVYRSVEVSNPAPGWSDYPALIVANHPTGFSDPALLLGLLGRSPRFLAKSTLWKTPGVGWFLDRIGAIPVYRSQDGSTSRNDEMFAAVYDALGDGETVALFPEGEVHDEPSLGPVKTGAARIAIGARAAGAEGLRIVPIGIHLEEKAAIRSRAFVEVGAIIDLDAEVDSLVGDTQPTPEDHHAVHLLTNEIAERLGRVTPEFDDVAEQDALSFAAEVAIREPIGPRHVSYADRQRVAGAVARRPEPDQEHVAAVANTYRTALGEPGIDDADVVASQRGIAVSWGLLGRLAGLVLLAPLAAVGIVMNIVPYLLLRAAMLAKPRSMTPATVRLVAAVVLFLTMWIVWGVVGWQLGNATAGLVAFVAGPIYGAVAIYVLDWSVTWWRDWWGRRKARRLGDGINPLLDLRQSVVASVEGALQP